MVPLATHLFFYLNQNSFVQLLIIQEVLSHRGDSALELKTSVIALSVTVIWAGANDKVAVDEWNHRDEFAAYANHSHHSPCKRQNGELELVHSSCA